MNAGHNFNVYMIKDSILRLSLSSPYYYYECLGKIIPGNNYLGYGEVQLKMFPTISFSGMYRKSFIYRRNRNNSQEIYRIYLSKIDK